MAIDVARITGREFKRHGDAAVLLTTAQRIEASRCYDRFDGTSLTEAVDFFLHQHPLAHRDKTFEVVVAELLEKKTAGNRREHYVNDLEWKFELMERFFPDRQLASITTEDMEKFIASQKWSPGSQKSYVQTRPFAKKRYAAFALAQSWQAAPPTQTRSDGSLAQGAFRSAVSRCTRVS